MQNDYTTYLLMHHHLKLQEIGNYKYPSVGDLLNELRFIYTGILDSCKKDWRKFLCLEIERKSKYKRAIIISLCKIEENKNIFALKNSGRICTWIQTCYLRRENRSWILFTEYFYRCFTFWTVQYITYSKDVLKTHSVVQPLWKMVWWLKNK